MLSDGFIRDTIIETVHFVNLPDQQQNNIHFTFILHSCSVAIGWSSLRYSETADFWIPFTY